MGYMTSIALENVRVKTKYIARVRKNVKTPGPETREFDYILENVDVGKDGAVRWLGEAVGEWYKDSEFAHWLGQYCETGKVLFFSEEGDDIWWGYEFDGKGNVREFDGPDDEDEEEEEEEHYERITRLSKTCTDAEMAAARADLALEDVIDDIMETGVEDVRKIRKAMKKADKLLARAEKLVAKARQDISKYIVNKKTDRRD